MTILETYSKKRPGLAPGTLEFNGQQQLDHPEISLIHYDYESVKQEGKATIAECLAYRGKPLTTWINVDGIHHAETIKQLGEGFGVHPLILEDVMNAEQRPKVEIFENVIAVSLKMLYRPAKSDTFIVENISLLLFENAVISFQETSEDVLEPIRKRINNPKWQLRQRGADYLFYAVIDTIVDHYFIVLEEESNAIESLEEELLHINNQDHIGQIHQQKRNLMNIKKAVWPLREVIQGIKKSDSTLITTDTRLYLADVADHLIQAIDMLESYRELVGSLREIHLSALSYRMNDIMKVLTLFSAIFIPLTFIAGIYGMNFDAMPELHWKWGYPSAMALMLFLAVGMLMYFKKKRWL